MRSILLLAPMLIVLFATMPPLTLYDGAVGDRQLPAQQGKLQYQALNLRSPFTRPDAVQTYDTARKLTVLDTTAQLFDAAGYGTALPAEQALSRTAGFTLTFTIAIETEDHSNDDRAGWSVLVLGDDAKGIEIGFWEDRVWAQEGNARLFTRAETATLATTTLREYVLSIVGDTYTLNTGDTTVLSGAVRDYSNFEPPAGFPQNPYRTPNFIFFGDNSSSAAGRTAFARAAIARGVAATPTPTPPTPPTPAPVKNVYLPYIAR